MVLRLREVYREVYLFHRHSNEVYFTGITRWAPVILAAITGIAS
jgi:hypothetical protein